MGPREGRHHFEICREVRTLLRKNGHINISVASGFGNKVD